jgi:RNA polymerase sigma-70 factor (ECF subfamily)
MALAYKRGELPEASDEVKRLAGGMSEEKLQEFAATSGLAKGFDAGPLRSLLRRYADPGKRERPEFRSILPQIEKGCRLAGIEAPEWLAKSLKRRVWIKAHSRAGKNVRGHWREVEVSGPLGYGVQGKELQVHVPEEVPEKAPLRAALAKLPGVKRSEEGYKLSAEQDQAVKKLLEQHVRYEDPNALAEREERKKEAAIRERKEESGPQAEAADKSYLKRFENDPGNQRRSAEFDQLWGANEVLMRRFFSAAIGQGSFFGEPGGNWSADAEDAYQQALVNAWKGLHSYDPSKDFLPWFTEVAKKAFFDIWREKNAEKRGGGKVENYTDALSRIEEDAEELMETLFGSDAEAVHQAVMEKLDGESYRAILADFPERFREPMLLYLSGFSMKEIAEAQGKPEGTVRTNLSLARDLLANDRRIVDIFALAMPRRYQEWQEEQANPPAGEAKPLRPARRKPTTRVTEEVKTRLNKVEARLFEVKLMASLAEERYNKAKGVEERVKAELKEATRAAGALKPMAEGAVRAQGGEDAKVRAAKERTRAAESLVEQAGKAHRAAKAVEARAQAEAGRWHEAYKTRKAQDPQEAKAHTRSAKAKLKDALAKEAAAKTESARAARTLARMMERRDKAQASEEASWKNVRAAEAVHQPAAMEGKAAARKAARLANELRAAVNRRRAAKAELTEAQRALREQEAKHATWRKRASAEGGD